MKRYIIIVFIVVLALYLVACKTEDPMIEDTAPSKEVSQTKESNIYKEDYLQACTLISKNYIYLEKKLNKTRDEFLNECKDYADNVDWSKGEEQFIEEIKNLRSKFNDGHFGWVLDKKLWLNERGKYLGFTLTIGADYKVYVGKVYSSFTDKLSIGDEIIKWNGNDIKKEITKLGKMNPQSTQYATNEIAARRLTIEYPNSPLRKKLTPVTITIKDKNGKISEMTFSWKDCSATQQWQNMIDSDGQTVLLTLAFEPSLEDIPEDVKYIHPSLLYYTRNVDSKKYIILHPRDFYLWKLEDIEKTFESIIKDNPDALIVDLKDSAGGSFEQVMYLSNMLNVKERFQFFYDRITQEKGLRLTEVSNFDFVTEDIIFTNVWKGDVVFRINPITKSGGDFFSRWMQLSERGRIIGLPSAGAGGGTDSFTLENTKTIIEFPLRERIIMGDSKSIEENSVIPDYLYDGEIINFLKTYK